MNLFQAMRAFVITVQTGSMSGAANKLHISSAMVGQRISALEDRLGTKLLHRTTRRQTLTDFGEFYFEQCTDILERVSIAEMEAEALSSEARGTLRITAPVTFGSVLLMPFLKHYKALAPHVNIDIRLTDNNIDLVEERIDIAFRIGSVPDSRLIQRKLMPYKMTVCASSLYLDNRDFPRHPEALAGHDVLSFSTSAGHPLNFSKEGENHSISLTSAVTVNSGQALVNAAVAGLGVIIQPEILVTEHIRAGTLIRLLPEWSLRERPVSLLYYRDLKMTARLRQFIEAAITHFRV